VLEHLVHEVAPAFGLDVEADAALALLFCSMRVEVACAVTEHRVLRLRSGHRRWVARS
jgi:hypothetical protein